MLGIGEYGLTGSGLGAVAGGLVLIGGLNLVVGLVSLCPACRWTAAARSGPSPGHGAATGIELGASRHGWDGCSAGRTVGIGVAIAFASLVTAGLLVLSLGWMIVTGAKTLDRRLDLEILLRGATVGDAMQADGQRVAPHLTVDTFADRFAGPDAVSALPVVEGDRVLGVIGKRRLQRLGRRRLGATRAEAVMAVPPQAPFLVAGDALWHAVDTLNQAGLDGLAVVEEGRLAGMITRETVAAVIRRRVAAGHAPTPEVRAR